jgi:peptide/nickel transport system permease protein
MWYLLRRVVQMVFILAVLSAALFGILTLMPGNPVDLLITSNPQIQPEDIVRIKKLRGLDKPWFVQYWRWLKGYPEPARPAAIAAIPPQIINAEPLTIDLTPYLKDQNFTPPQELFLQSLEKLAPRWQDNPRFSGLAQEIEEGVMADTLLRIAQIDQGVHDGLVKIINEEGAKNLSVIGLSGTTGKDRMLTVGAHASGPFAWFAVVNSYGQKTLGKVAISDGHESPKATLLKLDIRDQQLSDEKKPFSLDLNKFVLTPDSKLRFSLIAPSVGEVTPEGQYTASFATVGQTVIMFAAVDENGNQSISGFNLEHGSVGHESRFNPGFIYFFAGDKKALGFSQTYKRPIYDLLFGKPVVCGDGKLDPGETCDDKNHAAGDGCSPSCLKDNQSYIDTADAKIAGFFTKSGRIGNTVALMLPALLLSLLIAIPLGAFSAYRQYSGLDYLVNFCAFVGISLPVFWFGIMVIYLFAEAWPLFPAGGVQTPGIHEAGTWAVVLDKLKHAVLPTAVLSVFYLGRWLRYMRASMLEVLPQDYIRTARAKGLSEWSVIGKHAFRNALIPVVTVLALSIPALFGGAVLTETVFSWPGVGRLQYDAVMNSDYYVAIVVFLVSAVLVMVGNLLADVIYLVADPRIRRE